MNGRPSYLEALEAARVAEHLERWPWKLAGTPPLGIDVAGSDIDVICTVEDGVEFSRVLWAAYSGYDDYRSWQWTTSDKAIVTRFHASGWEFEIFASPGALATQTAIRHFDVEERLLRLGGKAFRRAIVDQKLSGQKTEPAFSTLLELDGNPYQKLLDIAELDDRELLDLLHRCGFGRQTL